MPTEIFSFTLFHSTHLVSAGLQTQSSSPSTTSPIHHTLHLFTCCNGIIKQEKFGGIPEWSPKRKGDALHLAIPLAATNSTSTSIFIRGQEQQDTDAPSAQSLGQEGKELRVQVSKGIRLFRGLRGLFQIFRLCVW